MNTIFTATSNDLRTKISAHAGTGVIDALGMRLVEHLGLHGRVDVKMTGMGGAKVYWVVYVDGVRCGSVSKEV